MMGEYMVWNPWMRSCCVLSMSRLESRHAFDASTIWQELHQQLSRQGGEKISYLRTHFISIIKVFEEDCNLRLIGSSGEQLAKAPLHALHLGKRGERSIISEEVQVMKCSSNGPLNGGNVFVAGTLYLRRFGGPTEQIESRSGEWWVVSSTILKASCLFKHVFRRVSACAMILYMNSNLQSKILTLKSDGWELKNPSPAATSPPAEAENNWATSCIFMHQMIFVCK